MLEQQLAHEKEKHEQSAAAFRALIDALRGNLEAVRTKTAGQLSLLQVEREQEVKQLSQELELCKQEATQQVKRAKADLDLMCHQQEDLVIENEHLKRALALAQHESGHDHASKSSAPLTPDSERKLEAQPLSGDLDCKRKSEMTMKMKEQSAHLREAFQKSWQRVAQLGSSASPKAGAGLQEKLACPWHSPERWPSALSLSSPARPGLA
jgi:hypothetical protein